MEKNTKLTVLNPVSVDFKETKAFGVQELEYKLVNFMLLTPKQLEAVKYDKESTVLDLMLHSIVVNAINKGDEKRLDFLLNRLIGKVKDQVQVDGEIKVTVEDYLS